MEYKDKCWCNKRDCTNTKCYRYLSKEEENYAVAGGWWIAFADFDKTCNMKGEDND